MDSRAGKSKDRRHRQLLQGCVSPGVGKVSGERQSVSGCIPTRSEGTISRRALNRDLAVIVREIVSILFQQRQILALSSESLTLPRPFIFLLRLCA
ncbi:Uncharacterised protein [Pseudomonas fluorescens]|uniref:Uncharacterized protein n=1 Tax=Pseudomonas fluorescens TaxID=294 RepID=A0A3S4PYI2_PSEFL|nr:Uncharacterised protein [Pseudomonas fluorescens]